VLVPSRCHLRLLIDIWAVAMSHCNALPEFRDMQLSGDIRAYVERPNVVSSKKNLWSLEHLDNGFRGSFFTYDEVTTSVMSLKLTRMWLVQFCVLLSRREVMRRKEFL
jgi:hypothetical protein